MEIELLEIPEKERVRTQQSRSSNKYETGNRSGNGNGKAGKRSKQLFSVTGFRVKLSRSLFPVFVRSFLPAIITVAITSIGFLIDEDELIGRLELLVTAVLVELEIL